MPDGGTQSSAAASAGASPGTQTSLERARAEQLQLSQMHAMAEQQRGEQERLGFGPGPSGAMPDAGDDPTGPASAENPGQMNPAEQFLRSQASASFEAQGGQRQGGDIGSAVVQIEGAVDKAKDEIQGQIDRVNHYLLVEILPEVVAFDISCFGLTTCITLPIVYWPIAALWGIEVYNDYTGGSTPLTPRLSWKSFAPPGTEIDIPLPTAPLWIAWLAYVFLLGFVSIIWMMIAVIFATQIGAPIMTFLSGFSELLPFLPTTGGI